MIELLAPAGSMEALRAAVQNGANAVYLGCGQFNARQGAKNFTPQTLAEAVKYCHVRGVQVHLTLNTLVSDKEIPAVCEMIRHAATCGVDASSSRTWAWSSFAVRWPPVCPSTAPPSLRSTPCRGCCCAPPGA